MPEVRSTTFIYQFPGNAGTSASGNDMLMVIPQQLALSSITYGGTNNTTATATTASSLGLAVNSQFQVTITGASPSNYDGLFTATVTGANTFTYTMASNPGNNASGSNLIAGMGG